MANYEHTTREEFRNIIQQKLGEDGIHWPSSELNLCINEALLTFGAISGFWKNEVFLHTEENIILYDLFAFVDIGTEYIYPSIKYKDIIDWLNRDLMESITFDVPIGEFLTIANYSKAIEAKFNQFQQATNLVMEIHEEDIPANQNIVELPSGVIDIIRISFTEDNIETILDQADEQEITLNSNYANEVGTPLFYSTIYKETKNLFICPTPANVGTIKILYITGIDSEPIDEEDTIINLPNNLVPYIKFGILADIFNNEGVFHDPVRAAYCNKRWQEGILIGRNYTTALLARINGDKIINMDSLGNVDLYSDDTKVRTAPTVLGFGGLNIFRTDVIPSEVQYTIGITVNSNAPLPQTDANFIKVDLEYIDTIADYVVHLAKFRNGAHEVATTNNLKDNFLRVAVNHNRRLLQAGITFDNLLMMAKKQESEQPRIPNEE